jgi:hypothetical protein
MRDELRVVIHLGRKAGAPYFIKIVQGDNRVTSPWSGPPRTYARSFRFCVKRSTSP